MIYAIGYRDFTPEQGHQFVIQKDISKEEYDRHNETLAEAHKIKAMTHVYDLLKRNGNEFLDYCTKIKEDLLEDRKEKYLEANRLLINYLSSLSMFVDYGERHNKKHFGKARMEQFRKKTNEFYDGHVSYRFMAMMRQYAVHYGFPLAVISQSVSGLNGIYADKQTLLKFSGWKHARTDIETMPDRIAIEPHVKISTLFIQRLYEDFIYDIAPVAIKGIEHANHMLKESGGKPPLLAKYKNIEELKQGKISYNLIEPNTYMEALEIIQRHPSITINQQ